MRSSAIIGCSFGDEGKGNFTNYLCQDSYDNLVVRFSGGQQAGHTVVYNGVKHVFSSFGSGSLSGVPTYWSEFCSINPDSILGELEVLLKKSIEPILFIDNKCPVTTPFDVDYNRSEEYVNQHGSCGAGFGSTINRQENFYSLMFGDLFYPNILREKLRLIEQFYNNTKTPVFMSAASNDMFLEMCDCVVSNKYIKSVNKMPSGYNYIFEGSQGLMLDKNIGFFPHVTRANTGTKNILELTGNNQETHIYLVTRAYQTRHGNGYMSNKNISHNIKANPDETNVTNKYQGKFRRGLLDVSMIEYAINKDDYIRENEKSLVITCLDHIKNEYRFTYKDEIIICDSKNDFINKVSKILRIKTVYISSSEESKSISRYII